MAGLAEWFVPEADRNWHSSCFTDHSLCETKRLIASHTQLATIVARKVTLMSLLINALYRDEAGFIVSAELVLVSTIAVLAMIVGLSEVALNVNNELEDVGSAYGKMSQAYQYYGLEGHNACFSGSSWYEVIDFCDEDNNIVPNNDFLGERI